MTKKADLFPARVTMLDAVALDNEIFNILKAQLQTILQIVPPWTLEQHEIKLDILLIYLLWKLSLPKYKGTFGQRLLNMKYIDSQLTPDKQKLLLMAKILSYLQNNELLVSRSVTMSRLLKTVDVGLHLGELINLLIFFCEGKYPSIIDRLLGLRLVCAVNRPRNLGYSYMTRELIWHGFLELLTFTMSVVNYQYVRRMLMRFLFKVRKSPAVIGLLDYTVVTKCSICSKTPIMPQHMGCSHVFCYYCLQTNRLVDSKFECPSCGYFGENVDFVKL